ncbi:hypothetical protein MUY27_11340 [Mucilaginibacter sp. RS28]|uniref:Uncharacterized protein n=1 Tax=Mucilaginibacter straminoryzae TaxID=2932774 RepID=A0A9X2BDG2_9SPHI|nr:hypothetical protein [Mucilaginibacter straminoryzae]MCJ8210303.1 hypothetical protein [Mucilaginibacter straminoryzae]
MKRFLLIALLALTACKKDNETVSDPNRHYAADGVHVDFDLVKWSTTRSDTRFGTVYVTLKGSTNADQVTVESHGDGLITTNAIPLTQDAKKRFDQTVAIQFTAAADQATTFKTNTLIIATKGSKRLSFRLYSEDLNY